jgi:tRNA A-37 threonylcarbamoyl transferase component Bud32
VRRIRLLGNDASQFSLTRKDLNDECSFSSFNFPFMSLPQSKTQNPKSKTPRLTRRKLKKLPRESIHNARNWSKADVSIAEWPPNSGRRVVVKELKHRPLWFRILAGRYLLRREWKTLCALADLEGVPTPIARPDSDTIVMEFRPGQPLDKLLWWQVPDDVIEKIENLVAQIHARGITHGDLHGYNVLVDESGEVTLIDWATASTFGRRRGTAKALTFSEWRALDERALAKIKIVFAPVDMTPLQHDLLLNGGSRVYRFVKNFKRIGERMRGIDEATATRREEKRDKTLRLLKKIPLGQSAEEVARIKAERAAKKQRKQESELAKAQAEHSPQTNN